MSDKPPSAGDVVRVRPEFAAEYWAMDIGNRVGTVAYVEIGTLAIDFDGLPGRFYLLPDKVEAA